MSGGRAGIALSSLKLNTLAPLALRPAISGGLPLFSIAHTLSALPPPMYLTAGHMSTADRTLPCSSNPRVILLSFLHISPSITFLFPAPKPAFFHNAVHKFHQLQGAPKILSLILFRPQHLPLPGMILAAEDTHYKGFSFSL